MRRTRGGIGAPAVTAFGVGKAAEVFFAWLGIGALVGVGGAILVREGPFSAAVLVHYAIPYVLIVTITGRSAPRVRSAALRAAGCFVVFVVAYYAVVAVQFGAIPVLYASAWLAAALTVCPIGAALIRWAAGRDGVLPAAVFASAGAIALSDGSVGNLVRLAIGRLDQRELQPVVVSTAIVGAAVALAIVLVVPRTARTRLAAVALLVPLTVVTTYVGRTMHFGVGPYL